MCSQWLFCDSPHSPGSPPECWGYRAVPSCRYISGKLYFQLFFLYWWCSLVHGAIFKLLVNSLVCIAVSLSFLFLELRTKFRQGFTNASKSYQHMPSSVFVCLMMLQSHPGPCKHCACMCHWVSATPHLHPHPVILQSKFICMNLAFSLNPFEW